MGASRHTASSKARQGQQKYVRLSQFEYETIFEKDPSFNEKRAFVEGVLGPLLALLPIWAALAGVSLLRASRS